MIRKTAITLVMIIALSISVLSMTLIETIDYALDNAPGLKMSFEDMEMAKIDRYSSISNFLPKFTVSAGYTKLDSVPTFTMPTPMGVQEIKMAVEDNYSVDMQLSMPIFMGGKLINGYLISRRQNDIKNLEYSQNRSDIKMAVIQMYMSGLLMEESIDMIESLLKAKEEHLNSARSRYEAGAASRLELLSARTQYNAVKPRVAELKNAKENLMRSMKILIGMPFDAEIELETGLVEISRKPKPIDMSDKDKDELSAEALRERKDIKILEKNVDIVDRAALMAKLAFLPNIVGFAQNSYNNIPNPSQDSLILFSDTLAIDQSFTWGLSMSFDVFTGGKRVLDIMKSGHQQKQIKMAYANMKNQVKAEVREMYDKYSISQMNMDTYESGLELAEEAWQMAKDQYRQGIISNSDYLDAESGYIQAKADYSQGLYNLIVQYYSLLNAVGLL